MENPISLILLWGLDPWPLDPLGYPKCFKDFLNKEKERKIKKNKGKIKENIF